MKKIIIQRLEMLLVIAVFNGYRFNDKYDTKIMYDWIFDKRKNWIKKENPFINNKYYYGIIFDKEFLICLARNFSMDGNIFIEKYSVRLLCNDNPLNELICIMQELNPFWDGNLNDLKSQLKTNKI